MFKFDTFCSTADDAFRHMRHWVYKCGLNIVPAFFHPYLSFIYPPFLILPFRPPKPLLYDLSKISRYMASIAVRRAILGIQFNPGHSRILG